MFYEKLIEERQKLNMSKEDLAKTMNVSKSTISKWESGMTMPDLENVLKLSEIFNVSTDYLLKDRKAKTNYSFYTVEPIKEKKEFSVYKLVGLLVFVISTLGMITLLIVSSLEPIIIEYNGREIGGIIAYCLSSSNFLIGTIFLTIIFILSLIMVIIPDRKLNKIFVKK